MNNLLREVTIDDIKEAVAIGPFGSRMKADLYVDAGVPVIRGNNLSQGRRLAGEFVYISEATADALQSCNVKPGDLVFPHRGAIGEVGIIPEGTPRAILSTSLMKLRVNKEIADPAYVFYFFQSAAGRAALLENASQVGTPGIATPLRSLRSIRIPLPDLNVQSRIVEVLGYLDDKIELNRWMNETLEEMARTIFRSWFVDFDPVRIKARGGDPVKELGISPEIAALFPDSFVESELGEIPSGWSVGCFGDIAYQIRQSAKAADIDVHEPYVGLEHIARKSLSLSEWGRGGDVSSQKTRFQTGNILFGKLRPYFHKVCIAPIDGVCSTDIVVIGPKHPELHSFVALWASESSMIESVTSSSGGTRMPRTSWSDIARFGIPIPPSRVIQAFESIVAPMIRKLMMSVFEQQALTETRDYLLPKLLSGEVEVAEKRTQDSQNLVEVSN